MYSNGATPFGDQGYQQVLQRHRDQNHGLLQSMEGVPAAMQRCGLAVSIGYQGRDSALLQAACAMLGLHHHSPPECR